MTMNAKSFKQMIKDGEVKRADAMKIPLDDIHEEPGFNLREEGPELEASIRDLAAYIMGGGMVPALEVRPRADGGVYLVDGHRRRRAYILAREQGAPIDFISIVPFTGNDADRVARIMTSAEGRGLSPLEVARGYKRLAAFGLTADEIAQRMGKTRQHVDQLLTLANANTDVQKMVAAGAVSAAVAVKVVRKAGEDAGKVLNDELGKAKAAGKAKVTDGTIKGKALPQKVVAELEASASALVLNLPIDTHAVLKRGHDEGVQAIADQVVQVPAGFLLELVEAYNTALNTRASQAEKARERAAKAAQTDLEDAA